MRAVVVALVTSIAFVFRSRLALQIEVLALRHQLALRHGHCTRVFGTDSVGSRGDGLGRPPTHFKTAWAAVRSPEGSTPFLLRQCKRNREILTRGVRSAENRLALEAALGYTARKRAATGGVRCATIHSDH